MSAPSAFCRAQWATRRPAAEVCRSASEDLPAQKDSSANLSSRRVPIRGKPRVAVLTVIFLITLLGHVRCADGHARAPDTARHGPCAWGHDVATGRPPWRETEIRTM